MLGFLITASVAVGLGMALRTPNEPSEGNHARDGMDGMGSAIPTPECRFLIAALVVLQHEGSADAAPGIYVSRKTMNRLRNEAGGHSNCDGEGLSLEVTTGPDSSAWLIPQGTRVRLTIMRDGVPVPETIVAGDSWFAQGVSVFAAPCEPTGESPAR